MGFASTCTPYSKTCNWRHRRPRAENAGFCSYVAEIFAPPQAQVVQLVHVTCSDELLAMDAQWTSCTQKKGLKHNGARKPSPVEELTWSLRDKRPVCFDPSNDVSVYCGPAFVSKWSLERLHAEVKRSRDETRPCRLLLIDLESKWR